LEGCISEMRKKRRTQELKRHLDELEKAKKELALLETKVRNSIPEIFTECECNLPKGETVIRTHQPTKVRITLHGGANKRLRKLTFEKLAVGSKVDIQCRPEDINLTAYLIVHGEEALMMSQNHHGAASETAWIR